MFSSSTAQSITTTGQRITLGPLLSPGLLVEAGVVLTADAAGNVLEIIWPGLAGLPPGALIMRLQLARWSAWVQTGRRIDVRMTFNATAGDGSTATYNVSADHVLVPQSRWAQSNIS